MHQPNLLQPKEVFERSIGLPEQSDDLIFLK